MAMVEVTGSASDIWDLLLHIKNAAVANGYSQNEFIAGNPGLGVLRLQRNGKYFNIYALDDDPLASGVNDLGAALRLTLSTGFTASALENSQPDETQQCIVNMTNGPYQNHWFFIDDAGASQEAVFAGVIEFQAGYFRHVLFGDCRKQGNYVGGEFTSGLYWVQWENNIDQPSSSFHCRPVEGAVLNIGSYPSIRADLSGTPTFWRFGGSGQKYAAGNVGPLSRVPILREYIDEGPNDWGERTITGPIKMFTMDKDVGGSGRLKPRGYLPTVHIANIRNYQPGEVLPNTDYKIFPFARKGAVGERNDVENSEEFGLAYKFQ